MTPHEQALEAASDMAVWLLSGEEVQRHAFTEPIVRAYLQARAEDCSDLYKQVFKFSVEDDAEWTKRGGAAAFLLLADFDGEAK